MTELVFLAVVMLVLVVICELARLGLSGSPLDWVAVASIFLFGGPLIRSADPPPALVVAFVVYSAALFGLAATRLRRDGPAPWD